MTKRTTSWGIARAAAAVGVALVVAAIGAAAAGCGADAPGHAAGTGGRATPSAGAASHATPAAAATASPSPNPTTTPSTSVTTRSAVTAYDDQLGGIYQITALTLTSGGRVTLEWVAAAGTGGKPEARIEPGSGSVAVYLSDTRPHTDLKRRLTIAAGPVGQVSFEYPPDDSLVVLRVTARQAGAQVSARAKVSAAGDQGRIVVTLR